MRLETEEEVESEEETSNVSYETPALGDTATVEVDADDIKKRGGGKKGKKGRVSSGAGSSELNKLRPKLRCGFCRNSMTQSEDINIVEVEKKKIPKRPDGKYAYKSLPGLTEGKLAGVVCDNCLRQNEEINMPVRLAYAVAVTQDGNVQDLPVANLK
jgi:hypothetical protein